MACVGLYQSIVANQRPAIIESLIDVHATGESSVKGWAETESETASFVRHPLCDIASKVAISLTEAKA